jgi:hypothetical protein
MIWKCEQCPDEAETLNEVNAHEETSGHTMRRFDPYAHKPCTCLANGCSDYHLKCFCGCERGHGTSSDLKTRKATLLGLPDPYACVFSPEQPVALLAEYGGRDPFNPADDIPADQVQDDDAFDHLPAWGEGTAYSDHGPDK